MKKFTKYLKDEFKQFVNIKNIDERNTDDIVKYITVIPTTRAIGIKYSLAKESQNIYDENKRIDKYISPRLFAGIVSKDYDHDIQDILWNGEPEWEEYIEAKEYKEWLDKLYKYIAYKLNLVIYKYKVNKKAKWAINKEGNNIVVSDIDTLEPKKQYNFILKNINKIKQK